MRNAKSKQERRGRRHATRVCTGTFACACACVCDVRAILYHISNSNPNCELRVSKIKTKLKLKLKPRLTMRHVLYHTCCETPARCEGPSTFTALNASRAPAGAACGWVLSGESHAQTSRALHLPRCRRCCRSSSGHRESQLCFSISYRPRMPQQQGKRL